jgi:ketosteroid isomerase-like protein
VTPEPSVRLVKQVFEAFTQRDVPALLGLVTPDVEFFARTADIAQGGAPYVGYEGMRQYMRDVGKVWRELRVIPQAFRSEGDRVLVTGRVYARDHGGSIIDSPAAWIFAVEGDLVALVRVYDRAEDAVTAFDAT